MLLRTGVPNMAPVSLGVIHLCCCIEYKVVLEQIGGTKPSDLKGLRSTLWDGSQIACGACSFLRSVLCAFSLSFLCAFFASEVCNMTANTSVVTFTRTVVQSLAKQDSRSSGMGTPPAPSTSGQ